jgi:hypothetical protein
MTPYRRLNHRPEEHLTMKEFASPGPVAAEVRLGDGLLEIVAEPRDTVAVTVTPMGDSEASQEAATRTTVELRGSKLIIKAPDGRGSWWRRRGARVHIAVRVPVDSSAELRIGAADATCAGVLRTVTANLASGDLTLDQVAGNMSVNTASGDIRATHVGGDMKVNSASGDLTVGSVDGAIQVHSASGRIAFQRAGASVRANTASGDITIGETHRGAVKVNSASGDIAVGVAPGTSVWMDITTMSGRARSDLDTPGTPAANGTAELALHLRTMSGDVTVHRST